MHSVFEDLQPVAHTPSFSFMSLTTSLPLGSGNSATKPHAFPGSFFQESKKTSQNSAPTIGWDVLVRVGQHIAADRQVISMNCPQLEESQGREPVVDLLADTLPLAPAQRNQRVSTPTSTASGTFQFTTVSASVLTKALSVVKSSESRSNHDVERCTRPRSDGGVGVEMKLGLNCQVSRAFASVAPPFVRSMKRGKPRKARGLSPAPGERCRLGLSGSAFYFLGFPPCLKFHKYLKKDPMTTVLGASVKKVDEIRCKRTNTVEKCGKSGTLTPDPQASISVFTQTWRIEKRKRRCDMQAFFLTGSKVRAFLFNFL